MRWTEQKIAEEIHKLKDELEINRMPNSIEMKENKKSGLLRAILLSGGMKLWADKLNLETKKREKMWTDELIKEQILSCMQKYCIKRMPTASELTSIGRNDLHCAISKSEYKYSGWARKLGLETKASETSKGNKYEYWVKNHLVNSYQHLWIQKMTTKHPYDLLVNGCVKVDVKVAAPHHHFGSRAHTFALNKKFATCDIYVCVALDEKENIEKCYIIPSSHVQIVTLNVCENGKYNKYIDNWNFIYHFVNAYERAISL